MSRGFEYNLWKTKHINHLNQLDFGALSETNFWMKLGLPQKFIDKAYCELGIVHFSIILRQV